MEQPDDFELPGALAEDDLLTNIPFRGEQRDWQHARSVTENLHGSTQPPRQDDCTVAESVDKACQDVGSLTHSSLSQRTCSGVQSTCNVEVARVPLENTEIESAKPNHMHAKERSDHMQAQSHAEKWTLVGKRRDFKAKEGVGRGSRGDERSGPRTGCNFFLSSKGRCNS